MDRQAESPIHPQFLGADLEVRAEEGTLHLVHKTVGVRHRLTIPEALCFSFLAATDDLVEVAQAVSTYLEEDSGTFWVKRVTGRYRTYLCGEIHGNST